jgi:flagellar protein FliO/FliZ
MISARERIVLLEVGDEWIVIGIVPGQIKTLHTLPKGEIPNAGGSEKSFGQWLKQISERKKNELE